MSSTLAVGPQVLNLGNVCPNNNMQAIDRCVLALVPDLTF